MLRLSWLLVLVVPGVALAQETLEIDDFVERRRGFKEEGGVLVAGKNSGSGERHFLQTNEMFGDVEVAFEVKFEGEGLMAARLRYDPTGVPGAAYVVKVRKVEGKEWQKVHFGIRGSDVRAAVDGEAAEVLTLKAPGAKGRICFVAMSKTGAKIYLRNILYGVPGKSTPEPEPEPEPSPVVKADPPADEDWPDETPVKAVPPPVVKAEPVAEGTAMSITDFTIKGDSFTEENGVLTAGKKSGGKETHSLQSKAMFGDVEISFEVNFEGPGAFSARLRYNPKATPPTSYQVRVKPTDGAFRKVVFRAKGGTIQATIDGEAAEVDTNGTPGANGRIWLFISSTTGGTVQIRNLRRQDL